MSPNATISCSFAHLAACPQGRLSFEFSPVSSEKYYSRLPLALYFFHYFLSSREIALSSAPPSRTFA